MFRDAFRISQLAGGVASEICAKIGFKMVDIHEDRIERIRCDAVKMEESASGHDDCLLANIVERGAKKKIKIKKDHKL